jgi:hypothetical protein
VKFEVIFTNHNCNQGIASLSAINID